MNYSLIIEGVSSYSTTPEKFASSPKLQNKTKYF